MPAPRNYVYVWSGCPWCTKIKSLLRRNGYSIARGNLEYREVGPLGEHVLPRGLRTVPQFYLNGRRIGGFEDTAKYFKKTKSKGSSARTTSRTGGAATRTAKRPKSTRRRVPRGTAKASGTASRTGAYARGSVR